MTKCLGCGAELQTNDPHAPGYTPKQGSDYCQRCYRLIHYGDLTFSMRRGIDSDEVLKKISTDNNLILWVIDLFDFEAGIINGINRFLNGRDIILAAVKRDLLPSTLSDSKAARFVFSRLKEYGIQIKELVFISKDSEDGLHDLMDAVHEHAKGRAVDVIGRANSGKSTLLNRLMGKDVLTMSRYPGTTLDFNEMEIDGITFIDTPGLEAAHSLVNEVDEKELKKIIPSRQIKPLVYQLKGNQTFFIGGLARLDLYDCVKASCVWYISDALVIHRCKSENADAFWKKHYGSLLSPVPVENRFRSYAEKKEMEKMDVVIDGLGWASLHGAMRNVRITVPENTGITFRKAML